MHSTPSSRDLSSQLGALEIGALPAFSDATLEANGLTAVPGNTQEFNCPTNPVLCHRRIEDDASLETAGGFSALAPTTPSDGCGPRTIIGPGCRHIGDDAALESEGLSAGPSRTMPGYAGCRLFQRADDATLEAGGLHAGPGYTYGSCPAPTHPVLCRPRIDDDATLEANGLVAGPPPTTPPNGCPLRPTMICPRIDDRPALEDGALEASALSLTGPTDTGPCRPTSPIFCRRIDDGALEAIAGFDVAPSGNIGCLPVTALCRHIDDAALEQSALRAEPHQTFAGATCPIYSCRHVDGDAALEAQGLVQPGNTHGYSCGTSPLLCRRIDDDAALEAATGVGGGPTSSAGGCKPITFVPCRADS